MTLFGEIIGTEYDVVTLAKSEKAATPTTVQAPYPQEVKRVSAWDLETCYIFDPIVFNAINKNVQTIMAAGYRISCKDKKVEDWFVDFLDNIGKSGGDITFNELLEVTFQNAMVYGRHYLETVLNEYETKIVDLVSLDPKLMDFARDSMRRIVVDKHGKPMGYCQNLPYGLDTTDKGDQVPEKSGIVLINRQIFVLPERIAYFKLYTYGNRFDGLGLIEPAFRSIVRKQNIEEAQANSIYARGTYPLIDYVGNESHFPTPNMIKSASEKMADLAHNRYMAFPYWHKIEPIEVKQSEVVDNTMKWLRESASASLGMPMAFATGSGEATNRATLGTLQKFMEFSLKDIVGRICAQFKQQVFRRICAYEKFEEIPDLIWGDIGAESIDDKATRLQNYVKVGVLDPKIVSEFAIESEKLALTTDQKRKDNYEADIVKDGEKEDKKISDEPYQVGMARPEKKKSKGNSVNPSGSNAG